MGCFSVFSMYYPIPTTTIMIWFSLLVVMQAQEEKMLGALMMGNGPGRGFGCLACRHPCCFFYELYQARVPLLPPEGANVPDKLSLQYFHFRYSGSSALGAK